MRNSKVVELLKCLKPNEIGNFRKMLVSPFFTRKEVVKTLFEYLIKFHPDFEDEAKLDKSVVYKKVFGGKASSDEKHIIKGLKNPSYDLKNLLEQFFIHQELREDKVGSNHYLLNRLIKSNQEKLIPQQFVDTAKQIEKLKKSDNYYLQKFKLEQKKNTHANKQKREDYRAKELIGNLLNFFSIVVLKYGFSFKTQKKLLGSNDLEGFQEILDLTINQSQSSEVPLVRLYYLIVTFFEHNSVQDFEEIINQFEKTYSSLNELESLNLLIALINISNQRYMSGDIDFLAAMFNLYKIGVERNIFVLNGKIASHYFKYIVFASNIASEYDWAVNFIKNFRHYLKSDERTSTITYCEATILFSKGDFQAAIDKSNEIEFTNVFDKIALKNIVIRSYYELEEFHLFDYYKDSYKKFLHTNRQIGVERKERGLNFIRMLDNMMKSKNSSSINLKKLFDELSPMDCRKWVYDKLL